MSFKVGDVVRIIDTNTEIDGDVGKISDIIIHYPQAMTGKMSYVVVNENDRYILREEFIDLYQ